MNGLTLYNDGTAPLFGFSPRDLITIMMEPLRGSDFFLGLISIMMEPLRGSDLFQGLITIMMEPLRG